MKACLLILYFTITLLNELPAQTSSQYEINVNIKEAGVQTRAFLRYFTPTGPYLDSVRIVNGKFILKGKVPAKLTVARIYLLKESEEEALAENKCEVWLEEGVINIRAEKKLSYAEYSGSAMQEQFSELQKALRPVKKKNDELDEAYEKAVAKKDDEKKDKLLNNEYPALFDEKQKILGAFINKYPSSLISAFKFEEFCGDDRMDLGIVEPIYEKLDHSIRQHPLVTKSAERLAINKRTAPGMVAPAFSQTDTSGRPINLSSFKNKYLLIDFWAGWCVPCRAENPHLIKVYEQFKSKGLEILGVSLDGERKRWTNAIITDKLTWPQVSDLQIFDNAVAKQYGIISIPQNLLIGPDGKIIAWNLRGSALDDKLKELFK
jgi:thiol-disulfide isomerase/thioredoxin